MTDSQPIAMGPTNPQPIRKHWIAILYFYVAALIGLVFVLAGAAIALNGLAKTAFPATFTTGYDDTYLPTPVTAQPEMPMVSGRGFGQGTYRTDNSALRHRQEVRRTRREGERSILSGLIAVIIGTPVLIWHLRQARQEPQQV